MRQDGVMQQPSNFSLHGAVDLGARQAAAKRRQQAEAGAQGGTPGSGGSEFVIEATDATFNTEVVARSMTVPVIVDLWAEWCGPCKQLGPVLERLADEAAGTWVLAKVDVDANPQLSAALQVQSIPMVVAVIGGQLVPGFLGALPEAQVRQWLGQVLQVAQQLGLPGAGDQPEAPEGNADSDELAGLDELREPELAEAQQAMERGDLNGAADAFERMLANNPGHPVATVGLAQVNLFRRVNSYDQAQARKDAAAHPDDVEAQIRVADIEMSLGNAEEAFDRLLGVVRRTSGEDRNKVRQHLIGLFEIFPPRDPRVTKARSTLSSLLF